MAVSCVLHQPRGGASISSVICSKVSSPTSTTSRSCMTVSVRAASAKKSQSTSTSERNGNGGRSSSSSGGARKGSVAEKSMPGYQTGGGKGGGAQSGKGKKGEGSVSTAVETEFDSFAALPGPKPPAGFILDAEGTVVLVAPAANRIVTIVDHSSQRPLECMIRRAFQSSDGRGCLLLLPLDIVTIISQRSYEDVQQADQFRHDFVDEAIRGLTHSDWLHTQPLQILKIDEEREGLTELSDDDLQEILPSAIYALAKRRLHLIFSGFCLTARGGFCYTEEHILDFKAEYGEGLGGSLTEGVEIANFQVGNSEYIIYTPFDPVMFVVHRDDATGELTIADDELLDDEIVLDAIDEENEFQALVDEEEAMHETLREAK